MSGRRGRQLRFRHIFPPCCLGHRLHFSDRIGSCITQNLPLCHTHILKFSMKFQDTRQCIKTVRQFAVTTEIKQPHRSLLVYPPAFCTALRSLIKTKLLQQIYIKCSLFCYNKPHNFYVHFSYEKQAVKYLTYYTYLFLSPRSLQNYETFPFHFFQILFQILHPWHDPSLKRLSLICSSGCLNDS